MNAKALYNVFLNSHLLHEKRQLPKWAEVWKDTWVKHLGHQFYQPSSDSPIDFPLAWLHTISYQLSTSKMDPPQALTEKKQSEEQTQQQCLT
jgi:hypothetical protein